MILIMLSMIDGTIMAISVYIMVPAKIKAKKEETQEITDVEFNESDVKDEDSEDISE